jgi:hypothetical protein
MTTYNESAHAAKAYAIWQEMSEDERNGVRYGIFPIDRMMRSQAEGYEAHELCVGLMDIAKAGTAAAKNTCTR